MPAGRIRKLSSTAFLNRSKPEPPLLVTWQRPCGLLERAMTRHWMTVSMEAGGRNCTPAPDPDGVGSAPTKDHFRAMICSSFHRDSQIAARGAPVSMERVLSLKASVVPAWRGASRASVNTILSLLPLRSMWPACASTRPSSCSFASAFARLPSDAWRSRRATQMKAPRFRKELPQRILTEICPHSHFNRSETASTTSR